MNENKEVYVTVRVSRYDDLIREEQLLELVRGIVSTTASYNLSDTLKTLLGLGREQ